MRNYLTQIINKKGELVYAPFFFWLITPIATSFILFRIFSSSIFFINSTNSLLIFSIQISPLHLLLKIIYQFEHLFKLNLYLYYTSKSYSWQEYFDKIFTVVVNVCNLLNLLFINKIILKYYIELVINNSKRIVYCRKFIK